MHNFKIEVLVLILLILQFKYLQSSVMCLKFVIKREAFNNVVFITWFVS